MIELTVDWSVGTEFVSHGWLGLREGEGVRVEGGIVTEVWFPMFIVCTLLQSLSPLAQPVIGVTP